MQVHDFIRDTLTRRIPEHWHVCIEDDFVSQSKSTSFQSLWIQVASGEVFGLSPSQDAILRRGQSNQISTVSKPFFGCLLHCKIAEVVLDIIPFLGKYISSGTSWVLGAAIWASWAVGKLTVERLKMTRSSWFVIYIFNGMI